MRMRSKHLDFRLRFYNLTIYPKPIILGFLQCKNSNHYEDKIQTPLAFFIYNPDYRFIV